MRSPAFRFAVLAVLGLYFHVTPAMDVLFKSPVSWGQRWRMFHGFGIEICDVQFYRGDDVTAPVDRMEFMTEKQRANWSLRRLRNLNDVKRQARVLCKQGQIDDLRADVRCGNRKGWREVMHREEKLCK